MSTNIHRIGVVGLWHLGNVLCASWYRLGKSVVGVDLDPKRISKLQAGESVVFEAGLPEMFRAGLDDKRIRFTGDLGALSECDVVFLAEDTPVNEQDEPDTAPLKNMVVEMASFLKNGTILVVSAQAPIGLCRELRRILREQNATLELAYSPENLRLGEAMQCYLDPGRIILGVENAETEARCRDLFSQIPGKILAMNLESAEMVKHGINSFLATSIVFANHLSDLCEATGARVDDVAKGLRSDPRIGERAYLAPSLGFSGGTLGRDLQVLSRINGDADSHADLFETIFSFNRNRPAILLKRIEKILGRIDGAEIGVLGLTYKPGTSTLRRSLALEMAQTLASSNAKVRAYDPKADYAELSAPPQFEICPDIYRTAKGSDLLLLCTEWDEFKTFPWSEVVGSMNTPHFLDLRNALPSYEMKRIGFRYYSMGR